DAGGAATAVGEDLPAGRLALGADPLGVDRHHDALGAETLRRLPHEIRIGDRCRVDANLIGARIQHAANVGNGANATAHGQGNEHLLGDALDGVHGGVALLMGGGDVEEGDLVRALVVVAPGDLHRVAGIADIDKVDP